MSYHPTQVIPEALSAVVENLDYWFVIGGHAVRCFCPYRPSRDVDFGVHESKDLVHLVAQLHKSGTVEMLERGEKTIHLRWNGINVSVFVLDKLTPFVEDRRLSVTGILATKLHAILDRGTRRDFFDLYVTLQHHRLGIADCLNAMRRVYADQQDQIDEPLLLRALTYFQDAEREAALPAEGPGDWSTVKSYFEQMVGTLLCPPGKALEIQSQTIDITQSPGPGSHKQTPPRRPRRSASNHSKSRKRSRS